jgi:hypothetical protein
MKALAGLVVGSTLAISGGAGAAGPSIHVTPAKVHAGDRVQVSGSAGGCTVGNRVTLISRAFSHRHDFAGLPAVYARVRSDGRYGHSIRIPSGRAADRYSITARCGGGNFGVEAHLRVLNP